MGTGEEWLEARTTVPGALDDVTFSENGTAPDAPRLEGTLSLVGDDTVGPLRRLPLLYLGRAPLFGARNVIHLARRLVEVAELITSSHRQPTYALASCDFRGRTGLYAMDLYNRSSRRRRLERLGLTFSDPPFVRLAPDGRCTSAEHNTFSPEFLILANRPKGAFTSPAKVLMVLATLRLGPPAPSELTVLARLAHSVQLIHGDDPAHVHNVLKGA
jgi:hypothetical protein